jgi:hypothetical protein
VSEYAPPAAERNYGDAACPEANRNLTTLARWIAKQRPNAVRVRDMQSADRGGLAGDAGARRSSAGRGPRLAASHTGIAASHTGIIVTNRDSIYARLTDDIVDNVDNVDNVDKLTMSKLRIYAQAL